MVDSFPAGAPSSDFLRSPAATRVGELAAETGLFLFHFEHRVQLPVPEDWLASGADAEPPTWENGVLPEAKYQSYRHDLLLGSFHPSHRAKWTAHELCHGLVGFAWKPGATPLFHATAARLAELVPVALWYFLDEVGARRCERHRDSPALFGAFCRACEDAASACGSLDDELRANAARFVDRELAAIARTRREGRPIPHLWGTLDLCSDGLAYADAHGRRLASEEFETFCERFAAPADLDALEARVEAVFCALADRTPLAPIGRKEDWMLQDIAWRLLQVRADTDGDARSALDSVIDSLADDRLVSRAIDGYHAAFEEWLLPSPADVFAVGYDLTPGYGRSAGQIAEGLATVAPHTLALLEDAGVDVFDAFTAEDPPERRSLATRFAEWMGRRWPGPVAALARYEAAIADCRRDPLASLGAGSGAGLAEGVAVVIADVDVVALAEATEAGTAIAAPTPGGLGATIEGSPVPFHSCAVLVHRDAEGLVLADVEPEVARALLAGEEIPAAIAEELARAGLVVARAWPFVETP